MMHLTIKKKYLTGIFALFTAVTLLASCSKGGDPYDPRKGFPKEVTIEYRVKSPSGITLAKWLTYDNESGGTTDANNSPLPWSKKFTKRVEFAEIITVSADGPDGVAGTVTLEILVNDKIVETKSFTATGANSTSAGGNISYQFNNN